MTVGVNELERSIGIATGYVGIAVEQLLTGVILSAGFNDDFLALKGKAAAALGELFGLSQRC